VHGFIVEVWILLWMMFVCFFVDYASATSLILHVFCQVFCNVHLFLNCLSHVLLYMTCLYTWGWTQAKAIKLDIISHLYCQLFEQLLFMHGSSLFICGASFKTWSTLLMVLCHSFNSKVSYMSQNISKLLCHRNHSKKKHLLLIGIFHQFKLFAMIFN